MQLEMSIRIWVIGGSSAAEVVEDLLELRHDLDHDEGEDAHGEEHHHDRVDQGALDLPLQGLGRSLNSASRWRITSRAPPASPALIMLHVEPVEGLGGLGHRLGEGGPALDLVADVDQAVFQRGPAWLLSRILRLRRIGRPASCRIESCRVKVVRSLVFTPPRAKVLPGFAALRRRRPGLGLLDGDLRDEVAHLPDRRLGFVLVGGLDRRP